MVYVRLSIPKRALFLGVIVGEQDGRTEDPLQIEGRNRICERRTTISILDGRNRILERQNSCGRRNLRMRLIPEVIRKTKSHYHAACHFQFLMSQRILIKIHEYLESYYLS